MKAFLRTTECPACPCGNASASVVHLGDGRELLRYRQCGLLARAQIPTEEDLMKQYREEYWTRYHAEQVGPARDTVYGHAWAWLQRLRPSPGVLVDVGCGGGAWLAWCQERGWKGIGFDPSPQAVAYARARGLDAYEWAWPPCPLADATADVVTFINVLDHLRDPFQALQEAWRILRPGGLLYIRVPNGPLHLRVMSWAAAVRLSRLAVFHVYGFSRTAFCYHLPRLGFTVLAIQTAPPTQRDVCQETGYGMRLLRKGLKRADQVLYQVLMWIGLNRLPWGPSLEVMASKAACDTRH